MQSRSRTLNLQYIISIYSKPLQYRINEIRPKEKLKNEKVNDVVTEEKEMVQITFEECDKVVKVYEKKVHENPGLLMTEFENDQEFNDLVRNKLAAVGRPPAQLYFSICAYLHEVADENKPSMCDRMGV